MVEVEAHVKIGWMSGQKIHEDALYALCLKGAEALEELCCAA
jgi:hypothetical protein